MILDTTAVSAILSGDRKVARVLSSADQHHLTWIVVGEYEFGLRGSGQRTRLGRLFQELESESILVFPDRKTTDQYAQVRHELKLKGRPIPENDVWIAAVARQYDLSIVSSDAHFDHVAGVTRIGW